MYILGIFHSAMQVSQYMIDPFDGIQQYRISSFQGALYVTCPTEDRYYMSGAPLKDALHIPYAPQKGLQLY